MSVSRFKRFPLSSQELSDQAITAIAVVGIFIWALLLIYQEHNINTARTYSEARAHAREALISLQAYVLQVRELAVHAEGYGFTSAQKYREKYFDSLAHLEDQAKELDRRFAQLKGGHDARRKLQELVAHEKTLINSMMERPISENAALSARQLMLLYQQQEFITQEEHKIARSLRQEIDQQDENLKVYRQRFYATKHVVMIYSTLLVLASFGLVLKERRIRRRLAFNGHAQD